LKKTEKGTERGIRELTWISDKGEAKKKEDIAMPQFRRKKQRFWLRKIAYLERHRWR